MLHDILHTFGIVSVGAPHYAFNYPAHTSGAPQDLMYAGLFPWDPAILDVGHDDYYGEHVPSGVINLATSPFLVP